VLYPELFSVPLAVTALQKESRKLTKARVNLERQLNAITQPRRLLVVLWPLILLNDRKKRGRRKGHKMSAAGRKAVAAAQRLRRAKQKKEKAKEEK